MIFKKQFSNGVKAEAKLINRDRAHPLVQEILVEWDGGQLCESIMVEYDVWILSVIKQLWTSRNPLMN